MAFRKQTYTDKCVDCTEFATTRCKRCDAPYCGDHAPARKQRCQRCEEEFEREHPEVVETALVKRSPEEVQPAGMSVDAMKIGAGVGGISLLAFIAAMSIGGVPALGGVAALGVILGFLLGMLGLSGFFAKAAGEAAITGGAAALYRARKRLRKRARRKFLREHKPRALLTAGDPPESDDSR